MKRIIICILCVALLCGCSSNTAIQKDEKITVVTTIFPLYDFARAIGGDIIDVKMLIRPGSEVHSYDPLPSDMIAVYECDLFLYIGGESDKWVDTLLDSADINSLALIDTVEHEYKDHDSHGHGHDHTDEHIWTSPQNAVLMIEHICEKLCGIDPNNSEVYKENSNAYITEINKASDKISDTVAKVQNPFMLVADRFPFGFFAEQYGIEYEAAFDGCAVSTDISLKTMSRLTDTIEKRNINAVFCTELSNCSIANALREEVGVDVIELHSAHNVTLDDFENKITYVDILYRNITALERGLA